MRSAIAGFLAGVAVFSSSFAEDGSVLITAPRFPEEVRRLPASVTVITQEDIQKSAARTLPELLSGEVGFTIKDFFGNNAANTSVDLRGFGATGSQNTLILLDGRRLNDFDLSGVQWPAIPLTSIERIEIVRGSGAVLYGDAATTGIVNIVTRSPLAPGRGLELLGRVGSFDTIEGQIYASYASGTFGINGSLYGYSSDGYRANNSNEQQNSTLDLRWALGEGSLDVRLGTDRQDLRLPGGRFVQPSIGLDEYAVDRRGTGTPLDYASRDGARAGMSLVQRLGEAELSLGLDWREKDQRSSFDQSGFPTYRADELELNSLTPRIKMPWRNHSFVVGLDIHQWRYRSRRTDRPENLGQPTNTVTVTQDTTGFYLQDTIQLTPATIATAGWRSDGRGRGNDVVDPGRAACTIPFATTAGVRPRGRLPLRQRRGDYRTMRFSRRIPDPAAADRRDPGTGSWAPRGVRCGRRSFASTSPTRSISTRLPPASATRTCRRLDAKGWNWTESSRPGDLWALALPMPTPTRSFWRARCRARRSPSGRTCRLPATPCRWCRATS
jgi:iron complex outermembrane receptor protein